MRAVALASGSNGNAIYVETRDARLLFDVGVSGRMLAARGTLRDVHLDRVDAVLLSHGHHDHVCGAGVIARRFRVPVLASPGTWRRVDGKVGRIEQRGRFAPGATVAFGETRVHTVATPHDAEGSVAFVVEAEGRRLGVLTDLGHVFDGLRDVFATLDAAFLEANYDPDLLAGGPYPLHLQERIAGPHGHLANEECLDLVRSARGPRLSTVVLSHLSGNCNTPERALAAAAPLRRDGLEVTLARRDAPSAWVTL